MLNEWLNGLVWRRRLLQILSFIPFLIPPAVTMHRILYLLHDRFGVRSDARRADECEWRETISMKRCWLPTGKQFVMSHVFFLMS